MLSLPGIPIILSEAHSESASLRNTDCQGYGRRRHWDVTSGDGRYCAHVHSRPRVFHCPARTQRRDQPGISPLANIHIGSFIGQTCAVLNVANREVTSGGSELELLRWVSTDRAP